MKRGTLLLLALAAALLVAAAPVKPTADFYVNDYAGVLTGEDKAHILNTARQLEQQTGAQVAVLTVSSLEGGDVETYAHSVAENWALGKKGEDNGVLLLLSTGERLSRIEVGYGLEETLTDVLTGRIQDDFMLPHYREGDYSAGLREGVDAVASTVYSHYGLEVPEGLPAPVEAKSSNDAAFMIIISILFVLLLFGRRGGRGGFMPILFFPHGHRGSSGGGGFGGGMGGGGRFGGGGSSRRF